jgi:hypothetical protein
MPFMTFAGIQKSPAGRGGEGRVKYVFLSLRRQLRCLAEGKKGSSNSLESVTEF